MTVYGLASVLAATLFRAMEAAPIIAQDASATANWADMTRSLKQGLTPLYSQLICALLLVVAVIGVGLVAAGRRRAREIRLAAARIRQIADEGQLLSAQVEEVRGALPDRFLFRQQWAEFEESVIHVDGRVFNTLPAQDFLQDDAIVQDISAFRLSYRVVSALPGMATGLGLLGTFLGIAMGLGTLGEVADHQDQMFKSLPGVIANLSSAFWTSIFGVLIALVLTFFSTNSHERIHEAIDELHEAIDRRIPRITAERLLVRLLDVSEKQPEILESIRRESEEGRSYLQSIANDLAEKVGQHFRGAIQEVLSPQLKAVSDIIAKQVTQASTTSTEQARRFTDQMVKEVSGALGQSITSMSAEVVEAGRQMQHVGKSLEAAVVLANSAIQGQQQAVRDSGQAAITAHEQSREAASQVAAVQQSLAQLGELAGGMRQLQHDAASLLGRQQSMAAETQKGVAHFARTLGEGSDLYSQNASKLADVAGSLKGHLEALTTRVETLGAQTTQAGAALENAVKQLNSRLDSERALVAQYGVAARALEQAMKTAEPVTSHMASTAGALERAAQATDTERQRLSTLLEQIKSAQQNAATLTGQLSQGFASAEQAMRASATHAASVASSTEEWAHHATDAVRKFGTGLKSAVEDSLSRYDQALSTAVSSLRASMKELEDLAEEIASRQTALSPGVSRQ